MAKKILLVLFLVSVSVLSSFIPAQATIEENYKQLRNRFEEARKSFLAGDTAKSAQTLSAIISDQNTGLPDRAQAAQLLAELLRYTRDRRMTEEAKKVLETFLQESQDKIEKDFQTYLKDTLKFLDGKSKEPRKLESFKPLDLKRAKELARYALSLEKEDPVRQIQYEAALWEWLRSSPAGWEDKELAELADAVSVRLNNSFWSPIRTYEAKDTPSVETLSAVLKKFSEALRKKDEASVLALFHPSARNLVPDLISKAPDPIEYSNFQIPRLSNDGQSASMTCTVIAGGASGPKTVVFAKQDSQWLLKKV